MNETSQETNTANLTRTLIIATALVLLVLGGFYIWVNRAQPALAPAPVIYDLNTPVIPDAQPLAEIPTQAAPIEEGATVVNKPMRPIVPVPTSLETSDNQIKLAIADLAPAMAAWLTADQQLRKWVLAIDLMADGNVAKSYRPLTYPIGRFDPQALGVEPNVQYVMTTASFSRADLWVTVFTAIDPAHLAQYYQTWLPILDKAYQEQGKKDKFDQRFRAALQHVIDAKPLSAEPVLAKHGGVIYVYADEKLEAASDVEKMMWRLGADNSLKIQNYLKLLQQQLPR